MARRHRTWATAADWDTEFGWFDETNDVGTWATTYSWKTYPQLEQYHEETEAEVDLSEGNNVLGDLNYRLGSEFSIVHERFQQTTVASLSVQPNLIASLEREHQRLLRYNDHFELDLNRLGEFLPLVNEAGYSRLHSYRLTCSGTSKTPGPTARRHGGQRDRYWSSDLGQKPGRQKCAVRQGRTICRPARSGWRSPYLGDQRRRHGDLHQRWRHRHQYQHRQLDKPSAWSQPFLERRAGRHGRLDLRGLGSHLGRLPGLVGFLAGNSPGPKRFPGLTRRRCSVTHVTLGAIVLSDSDPLSTTNATLGWYVGDERFDRIFTATPATYNTQTFETRQHNRLKQATVYWLPAEQAWDSTDWAGPDAPDWANSEETWNDDPTVDSGDLDWMQSDPVDWDASFMWATIKRWTVLSTVVESQRTTI